MSNTQGLLILPKSRYWHPTELHISGWVKEKKNFSFVEHTSLFISPKCSSCTSSSPQETVPRRQEIAKSQKTMFLPDLKIALHGQQGFKLPSLATEANAKGGNSKAQQILQGRILQNNCFLFLDLLGILYDEGQVKQVLWTPERGFT